jgi:hypothetical protein
VSKVIPHVVIHQSWKHGDHYVEPPSGLPGTTEVPFGSSKRQFTDWKTVTEFSSTCWRKRSYHSPWRQRKRWNWRWNYWTISIQSKGPKKKEKL